MTYLPSDPDGPIGAGALRLQLGQDASAVRSQCQSLSEALKGALREARSSGLAGRRPVVQLDDTLRQMGLQHGPGAVGISRV